MIVLCQFSTNCWLAACFDAEKYGLSLVLDDPFFGARITLIFQHGRLDVFRFTQYFSNESSMNIFFILLVYNKSKLYFFSVVRIVTTGHNKDKAKLSISVIHLLHHCFLWWIVNGLADLHNIIGQYCPTACSLLTAQHSFGTFSVKTYDQNCFCAVMSSKRLFFLFTFILKNLCSPQHFNH